MIKAKHKTATEIAFKRNLKLIIATIFKFTPFFLSRIIVRFFPILTVCIPKDIETRTKRYLGDIRININTVYPIEQKMLSGIYDKQTQFIIKKFVKNDDVCLDIGANIGAISFGLAKSSGVRGRVYAIEPGTLTHQRLVKNIELNKDYANRIVIIKKGVSDKEGALYWREDPTNRGNASLSDTKENADEIVPVTTIDTLVNELGLTKIDFIKIDVEGMELEVIRGGIKTWENFRPIIYYETILFERRHRFSQPFLDIQLLLGPLGYKFYKIDKHNNLTETVYPYLSENTLAIPIS